MSSFAGTCFTHRQPRCTACSAHQCPVLTVPKQHTALISGSFWVQSTVKMTDTAMLPAEKDEDGKAVLDSVTVVAAKTGTTVELAK